MSLPVYLNVFSTKTDISYTWLINFKLIMIQKSDIINLIYIHSTASPYLVKTKGNSNGGCAIMCPCKWKVMLKFRL